VLAPAGAEAQAEVAGQPLAAANEGDPAVAGGERRNQAVRRREAVGGVELGGEEIGRLVGQRPVIGRVERQLALDRLLAATLELDLEEARPQSEYRRVRHLNRRRRCCT
jgi:hypothetical protein